jgi:CheY-like chemotaxis protein
VLVVADDLFIRELAVTLLEEEHCAVIAAAAPVDAVALLDEAAFDLVITDSFSRDLETVVLTREDVLRAAGATPAALFTAYRAD